MNKDEALKLALDFIENSECGTADLEAHIKEALAQPEQEPVLWMMPDGKTADKWALQFYGGQVGKPLYTSPPQRTWVGLTDEEIWETISRIGTSDSNVNPYAKLADARAIEAKLKEKNS